MQKFILLVVLGVLAFACLAYSQEVEAAAGSGNEDVSGLASSLGIDTSVLYEDLVRIRDQVVPLAEQY